MKKGAITMTNKEFATGLGFASIAIGLSEILMPRKLEKSMGIHNGVNTGILRVMGVREILQGVDILTHDDPTPGIVARVVGDVLDTALLGIAATKTRKPGSFATVFLSVMGIGLLDMICAGRLAKEKMSWKDRLMEKMGR
jgi:hypothetical protein